MRPRYREARERAGLSPRQASSIIGYEVAAIEAGLFEISPPLHDALAKLYGVTPCWLAGHDTAPDLTDLAQQAEDKGVTFGDWAEIVTLVQSKATCKGCRGKPLDGVLLATEPPCACGSITPERSACPLCGKVYCRPCAERPYETCCNGEELDHAE